MARRIPPLNPLRVFDAVARSGNLTAAAAELHVSQSAVSRQVALLEDYLGVELFKRERYGVSLTPAGRDYADQVVAAFAQIAGATEQLLRRGGRGVLRVRTYTTFAAKWLIPRLPNFQQRHPDIRVQLITEVSDVDFDRDPVDLAIQFGDGHWPKVLADRLFGDVIEPVCSPRYLAEQGIDPDHPEALLGRRLLVSHYRSSDWDDWLAGAGLEAQAGAAERMRFGSSVLAWQAALDGLGLAIGQAGMLTQELAQGTLVRPFRRPLTRAKAHYLLRPERAQTSPQAAAFRDWLLGALPRTPQE